MPKSKNYEEFVEKFKPKKTTDDCYTPPKVYDAVLGYVVDRWGIDPDKVVRPFYPGGDYESADYTGCYVVDNPPFSCLSKILSFYKENNVNFFLFAPAFTALSSSKGDFTTILVGEDITYENGAVVKTCFITNLPSDNVLEINPDLSKRLENAMKRESKRKPIYKMPACVLRTSVLCHYARLGVPLEIRKGDAVFIRRLDAQEKGKAIFGGALLANDRGEAAAQAAAAAAARTTAARTTAARTTAEKTGDVITYNLSEREEEMRKSIGGSNEQLA